MTPHRVFKYDVVADNSKDIEKFLSDQRFAKKIINPYANVGVIEQDEYIVQVEVREKKHYQKDITKNRPVLKLHNNTLNDLFHQINQFKDSDIAKS